MRRACERGLKVFDYGRSKQGTGSVRVQEELGLRAAAAALRVPALPRRRDSAEQSGESQVPGVHRAVAPAAARPRQPARAVHRAQPGLSAIVADRRSPSAVLGARHHDARADPGHARAAIDGGADRRAARGTSRRLRWRSRWRAILVGYWRTGAAMVAIWSRSDTFAHAFLVLPIALWLVWRARADLARVAPRPQRWVLVPLPRRAPAGCWANWERSTRRRSLRWSRCWCWRCRRCSACGWHACIAFPLAFLFFAVPFGEFLMPQLMEWTADFTVMALRLTGIPVYREGQQVRHPVGQLVGGRGLQRRALPDRVVHGRHAVRVPQLPLARRAGSSSSAFSIVVPIVANWVRAYMIVMIGHLSGNKLAVGVDHLIYGWVFFGVVILLMFLIGARWRDDDVARRTASAACRPGVGRPASPGEFLLVAVHGRRRGGASGRSAAGRSSAAMRRRRRRLPLLDAVGAWRAAAGGLTTWQPRFQNPSAELHETFARGDTAVGLYVGYYRNQSPSRKLVSSDNVLVTSSDRAWRGSAAARGRSSSAAVRVDAAHGGIARPRRRATRRLALVLDRRPAHGQRCLGQGYTALVAAHGRGDDAAVVVVYAAKERPGEAEAALDAFVRDAGTARSTAALARDDGTGDDARSRSAPADRARRLSLRHRRARERRRQPDQPPAARRLPACRGRADRGHRTSAGASRATMSSSSRCTRRRATASSSIRGCTRCSASCARPSCTRRNLAALEARCRRGPPACRCASTASTAATCGDLDGAQSQVPMDAPAVPAVRHALRRAVARPRALPACTKVGVPRERVDADLQRRRRRALPAAPAARGADRRAARSAIRTCGSSARWAHAGGQGPAQSGARVRPGAAARAIAARARMRLVMVGDGPLRSEARAMLDAGRRGAISPGCPASAPTCRTSCAGSIASCCRRWPKASRTRFSRRWRPACRSSRPTSAAIASWSRRDAPASSCPPAIRSAGAARCSPMRGDPDAGRAAGTGRARADRARVQPGGDGRPLPGALRSAARRSEHDAGRVERGPATGMKPCAASPASSTPAAGATIDRAVLPRMNDSQHHRGPDEEGLHVEPGVGLGHRRLSIIDLATGQQPLYNEDGTRRASSSTARSTTTRS